MVVSKSRQPGQRLTRNGSVEVTRNSHSLDLEPGVFTWKDPQRIAVSLMRAAEQSRRRNSEPFRSALSMLVFYINRAGRQLNPYQRAVLEQTKQELRQLYGR